MGKALKKKWNNNYPKVEKVYLGRVVTGRKFFGLKKVREPYEMDIRNFVRGPGDWRMRQILEREIFGSAEKTREATDSGKLVAIQGWVMDNVEYIGDKKVWNVSDFWQMPEETFALRAGDCEDGALLIASLLFNAGVDAWRVRVTCGYVQADDTAPQGGHAYVTYCDGQQWYPIDWCYYPEVAELSQRTPTNKRQVYRDEWFSLNNQYCWDHDRAPVFPGRVRYFRAPPTDVGGRRSSGAGTI